MCVGRGGGGAMCVGRGRCHVCREGEVPCV